MWAEATPALDTGPARPLFCSLHLSLKASGAPELDEDEGFGDWSQKAELRQPPRAESPEGEQEEDRQVGVKAGRRASRQGLCKPPNTCLSNSPLLPFPANPRNGPMTGGEREEENQTARRRRGLRERGEEISFLGSPGPWAPSRPAAAAGVATSAHICSPLT